MQKEWPNFWMGETLFFKIKYRSSALYAALQLVLVKHPIDHSRRIYSTSNFRFIQKLKNQIRPYSNSSYITKD